MLTNAFRTYYARVLYTKQRGGLRLRRVVLGRPPVNAFTADNDKPAMRIVHCTSVAVHILLAWAAVWVSSFYFSDSIETLGAGLELWVLA
jgi:hypothetical protein